MNHFNTSVKPAKLHGLDHLRALAITLVFLFHYRIPIFGHPAWVTDLFRFGWTGVDLFFVLSGFLIASQLFTQIKEGTAISFKRFFVKRFFRIIPAFWTLLIIYFCWPAFHEREGLAPLWKYLTFTQNFGLNIASHGTFSHAWSLCIEEHFYLILPLALIGLTTTGIFKRSYWLLVLLFVAGFCIRAFNWYTYVLPEMDGENGWLCWYKFIYYPTYTRLDGLLAGVAIAGMYQFYPLLWQKISGYGNLLLIVGLGILTGAYFLCDEQNSFHASVFGFPLVSLGYGFLVMGAISPTSILYTWNSKVTAWLATLSYAIYLSHKGVIHITQHLVTGVDANSNLMLLICSVCCVLAALALHFSIEKPFVRLRIKLEKAN